MEHDTQTSRPPARSPRDGRTAAQSRRLAAVLSADVAGYSRLMGDDDVATVQQLQECRSVFRTTIEQFAGTVIDTAGDSVLAELPSAVSAVQCARAIQGDLAARNQAWPEQRKMLFRIGINLGDVIVEPDGTLYGDGVNIAARIEALATPGSFSISGTIFDQVDSKVDLAFDFSGEHSVKNIERPVRVYRAASSTGGSAAPSASTGPTAVESDAAPAILVVDDNENNRYTLTRRLRKQGFGEPLVAEDGQKALETLASHAVDLVLLDIMMPEMSGYEVLEAMKADARLRDVPVVMISAIEDMDSVVRCIGLGAEDYLPKPFNATILQARVSACLEKRRLRRQQAAHNERLVQQKKRADRILRSLLPSGTVQRLRSGKDAAPERYEDVSLLHCEVMGFSARCEDESARDVLSEIRPVVDVLESAMAEHRLESLGGPAGTWVAAAGMHQFDEEATLACVQAGLSVLEAARRLRPRWDVRVVVHQGAVTAGLLGRNHYRFEAWGPSLDTLRCVARASSGDAVQITGPAWQSVAHELHATSRGLVETDHGPIEVLDCSPG